MTFVIAYYDTFCGGLGDRLVGLVSALALAKKLDKKLLIKWDHPNINGVFDLSGYDFYRHNVNLNGVVELNCIDNRFKYESLLSTQPIQNMWKNKSILLKCNQEIGSFLYKNPHLNTGLSSPSQSFSSHTMEWYKQLFPVILKPKLTDNAVLSSSPYIGIQLRTGDAYMGVGTDRPIHDVPKAINSIAQFILKQNSILFSFPQIIYFTTDHPTAKKMLQTALPNFTIIDTPRSRIHLEKTKSDSQQLNSLIQDLYTLSRANPLIISTYSNYGRLAALMNTGNQTIWGFIKNLYQVLPVSRESLFTKHPTRLHLPSSVGGSIIPSLSRSIFKGNRQNHLFKSIQSTRSIRPIHLPTRAKITNTTNLKRGNNNPFLFLKRSNTKLRRYNNNNNNNSHHYRHHHINSRRSALYLYSGRRKSLSKRRV